MRKLENEKEQEDDLAKKNNAIQKQLSVMTDKFNEKARDEIVNRYDHGVCF